MAGGVVVLEGKFGKRRGEGGGGGGGAGGRMEAREEPQRSSSRGRGRRAREKKLLLRRPCTPIKIEVNYCTHTHSIFT